jgi:hypothetical protein
LKGHSVEEAWSRFVSYGQGVEILQAGSQTTSHLDAWREAFSHDEDWNVERYEPGEWEKLVQPTLRVAESLKEWGGLPNENESILKSAMNKFHEVGELCLVLRSETGAKLCGKCGAEVFNIDSHLSNFHGGNTDSNLSSVVEVSEGRKTLVILQGTGIHKRVRSVSRELLDLDSSNPRYNGALASNVGEVIKLNGASFVRPPDGQYPVPEEITHLPALARTLRELIRMEIPSYGQGN